MEFAPTVRITLPPGTVNKSDFIALGKTARLYGGVTVDDNERDVLAEDDRSTLLRYTGAPDHAEWFVFVLGPYVDEPPLECGNCGRHLTRYLLEGQVVRITFECPDCEYHTSV